MRRRRSRLSWRLCPLPHRNLGLPYRSFQDTGRDRLYDVEIRLPVDCGLALHDFDGVRISLKS
jgi:hypothetical protein